MNCSTLRERAAGSPPSTSQVSLETCCCVQDTKLAHIIHVLSLMQIARLPLKPPTKCAGEMGLPKKFSSVGLHSLSGCPAVFAPRPSSPHLTTLLLPRRVCRPRRRAMPAQHLKVSEQARENPSPQKNRCDNQVSSWRHISCHTDKNRYYT